MLNLNMLRTIQDKFFLMFAIFSLCYYILAAIKAPIFGIFMILFLVIGYFVVFVKILGNYNFTSEWQMLLLFSKLQFSYIGPTHDRRILLFVIGKYQMYSKLLATEHSLREDLRILNEFRYECLDFIEHEKFFNDLCELCKNVEIAIEKRHTFYKIRIYLYNLKSQRSFKKKVRNEIKRLKIMN